MAGQPKYRPKLARDIAAILGAVGQQKPATRALLMTGIALACLQPEPASALTIDQLQVKSSLGQPLVSTTTARIGPGEALRKECMSAVATSDSGLTWQQNLDIAVAETSTPGEHPVRISTRTPMYEPMYEIRLKVKCFGNVTYMRDYVIMLNLPMTSPQTQPTNTQPANSESANNEPANNEQRSAMPATRVADESRSPAPDPQPVASGEVVTANRQTEAADRRPYTERFPTPTTPIDASSEYRVQAGDMLSTIAQRIKGRPPGSTYMAADLVFQLNPDAFINSNPDQLRLGAVLRIPAMNGLLAGRGQVLAESRAQLPDTNELVMESPGLDLATETAADEIVVTQSVPEAEVAVQFAPEPLVPVSELTATEAQPLVAVSELEIPATEPELEIVVDMREALEPITNIDEAELTNATERALTPFFPPETSESDLAEVSEPDSGMSMYPLLIAGLSVLFAFILAALFLDRRLLDFLMRVRRSRTTDEAMEAPDEAMEAPDQVAEADRTVRLGDPNLGESKIDDTDRPADSGVAEDVSAAFETDADQSAPAEHSAPVTDLADPDLDLNISGSYAELADTPVTDLADPDLDLKISSPSAELPLDLDLDLGQIEVDTGGLPQSTDAPAVNSDDDLERTFAEEIPLEATKKFSEADTSKLNDLVSAQEQSELEDSGTMRQLFSPKTMPQESAEKPVDDDMALTQDLPELNDCSPLDEAGNLQELSEQVAQDDPEDKLAATLTHALGLLEQDYEDVLTASQILNQKDIEKAIAEHDKED